jgi:glyoxylase-like metal-dependent hydrolase (beta-lactamase superfamily II)
MTLGSFDLTSLSDGTFRLDGGAMFGVVPKPLWEKRAPADERNRIPLGLRPLLVRTGDRTVIIDAGIGDKMSEKETDIYAIDRRRHLDHSLAAAGLTAADIDVVIATHLHFDHVGGFTVGRTAGSCRDSRTRPT